MSGGGWSAAELQARLGFAHVELHDRIGSTNDRALDLVRKGSPVWSVVIADEQTAGRGRRGRRWDSPRGSGLWMSVVVPRCDPVAVVPLIAGLAVAEAMEEVAGGIRVEVEWPNDLTIGGRKVGGILCESTPRAVVVGIGVNVSTAPRLPDRARERPVTALETDANKPLSRSALAISVVKRLRNRFEVASPWSGARDELRGRDALRGRRVETEQEGGGIADGIDDDGALLLLRASGECVRVRSGSVRLSGSAATEP